jgi:signal transduction histidine kinase
VSGIAVLLFAAVALISLYFVEVNAVDVRLKADSQRAFDELHEIKTINAEQVRQAIAEGIPNVYGYYYTIDGSSEVFANPPLLVQHESDFKGKSSFSTLDLAHIHLRIGGFTQGKEHLYLATNLRTIRELVEDLQTAYLWAIPIILIGVALSSRWIATHALKPIVEITEVAEKITVNRLNKRLVPVVANDEIGHHIEVLNKMFDRLSKSFDMALRFSADASHELRTPLTIMRGNLEMAVRSNEYSESQKRLLNELLEETVRLQKISEDLLLLANLDSSEKTNLVFSSLNLSELVSELAEDAELLSSARNIKVDVHIEPNILVLGDLLLLRRLILNLIDNAVRHNCEKGMLKLNLTRTHSMAIFTISNTATPIPIKYWNQIFDRFFKVDESRESEKGGSGLGLSICREIAIKHKGFIKLIRSDESMTEFSLEIPLRS